MTFAHSCGNSSVRPNTSRMTPAMICHTSCGTPSRAVVALSASVKMMIDSARPTAITTGRNHWRAATPASESLRTIEPPTMTGSNGSTQGARIVMTPATNETSSSPSTAAAP